ncbi:hypothetical protein SAMN04488550_2900 [Gordonia malaquae]|uniref:Uncharacterized protein n=3 Tax=Gordonia malaquae TaxID=410332 RepID=M3UTT4_GORML|nr:hypothetical protein GM1_004_02170 [Gordonia malaquae NBRC 108250]SED65316.1 hypothetical protein SAMN04488550_2900 [Gordonia malaquae]
MSDTASRASMDFRSMQSASPAADATRRMNTLYESMRKTAGPQAVAMYAAQNPAINPDMTRFNRDFVNDGEGGYRTATSLKEVVDYGTARRNRLSRPIKGKLDKHGEGAGERHAQTIVMQLPMYLLEEDGTFYHPLGKDGLPKDGKDDRPLVSLPRYRIKPEMQKEADRYVEAVMDFQAALLPGGQDAIHGGSLNLDEHRPHLQLLVDPFAANPRGKEPDALLNSFSYTFGRHPKDKINFPLRQKVDKRSRRPVFDKAGDPVMVAIGADGKMEMYHQRFKDYLVEKGFAIEAERDPVRHDRRVVGDMIDYGEAMDAAREAQEQSQTAMADLGAALETEDSAAGLMADLAAEIDVQKVELAAERRAADARAAEVIAEAERTLAAARERAAHAESAGYDAGLTAGVAEGREQGRAEGLSAVQELREELETAVEDGRKQGYKEGYDHGRERGRVAANIEYDLKVARLEEREAAVERWETETAPALRDEIRTEIENEMQADRDAATQARDEAERDRDEVKRRLDAIPVYDPAEAEKHSPAELVRHLKKMRDADSGKPVLEQAHHLGVQNYEAEAQGQGVDQKTFMTETRAERNERLNARGVRLSASTEQQQKKRPQGQGPGQS